MFCNVKMEQDSYNHFYQSYQSQVYENNSNLPTTPPPMYAESNYYQEIIPFSQFHQRNMYDQSFQTIFGIGNSIYNKTSTLRSEDLNFYLNSIDFCGLGSNIGQVDGRNVCFGEVKVCEDVNVKDGRNKFDEAQWNQMKSYEMVTGSDNSLDGKICEEYVGVSSNDSDDTGKIYNFI